MPGAPGTVAPQYARGDGCVGSRARCIILVVQLPQPNPMPHQPAPVSAREYVVAWVDSPVGRLRLVASDDGLAAIQWEHERSPNDPFAGAAESPAHPVLAETARQLDEYFAGTRRSFTVPLRFAGTDFQRQVWRALLTIPYGETRSYAQIARQIGRPRAVRAVGAANGRNPIPIIAPCHRVIGSTGQLVGFGGGLAAKARLLELEGARPLSVELAADGAVSRASSRNASP